MRRRLLCCSNTGEMSVHSLAGDEEAEASTWSVRNVKKTTGDSDAVSHMRVEPCVPPPLASPRGELTSRAAHPPCRAGAERGRVLARHPSVLGARRTERRLVALGGREKDLQLWDCEAQKRTFMAKNVRGRLSSSALALLPTPHNIAARSYSHDPLHAEQVAATRALRGVLEQYSRRPAVLFFCMGYPVRRE